MKKIILLSALFCCLAGCSADRLPPALNTNFSVNAVYKTGEFTYTCTVKAAPDAVYVTPTSTNAAGMTLSCDGKTVSFSQGSMLRSFPKGKLDCTNPAALLWEVLVSAGEGTAQQSEDGYFLEGKTSVGNYILLYDATGNIQNVRIPAAQIELAVTP